MKFLPLVWAGLKRRKLRTALTFLSIFFATMPVEPESFLVMFPEYLLKDPEKQAWLATRTGAILGALLAIALGIITGAIPAFQAMQLKISEALRRGG